MTPHSRAAHASDPTHTPFPTATVLGYPRIGPRRELKTAVERFWSGDATAAVLESEAAALRARTEARLVELGLRADDASIPSTSSLYDQVLDIVALLGAVPDRFADLPSADGSLDLAGYFTLARGEGSRLPLEMTKWFDSNYHYLVPEIGPSTPIAPVGDRPVRELAESLARGVLTRPVLVGPVTFLLLSKAAHGAPSGFRPLDRLDDVVAAYATLLRALGAAGASWVQLDEPALVADLDVPRADVLAAVDRAYAVLGTELAVPDRPALLVAAPYGGLGDALPVLAPRVEAVAVDVVRGDVAELEAALARTASSASAVPSASAGPTGPTVPSASTGPTGPTGPTVPTGPAHGRTLVAGVVDGHNVWRTDLGGALATLERLRAAAWAAGWSGVSVGTSTSLLHVPHDVEDEPDLDPAVRSWLAFADQKVEEVVTLATALADGPDAVADRLAQARTARASRHDAAGTHRADVRERVAALTGAQARRPAYEVRRAAQAAVLDLPPLTMTTIGSFPQTPQIRRARTALRRGELDVAAYEAAMRAHIADVVALQEELGLDVLVHGEPERNDMVQYFAELLDGFAVTVNGWVQSYGSRCVRPSILWGDVMRPEPMTVRWATYAASRSSKPVKGMLTGPVTILAWSFVRDDQPLADTARQVALALRDEAVDLEAAGIGIIQVDEPALRELLPLREVDRAAYLGWSVEAFRLATSGVRDATQIHTHLCYSEFGEVIDAIDGLDADVTSIEAARSRMEILADVRRSGFARGIGPGVYDIHSPRVPEVQEIEHLLEAALEQIPADVLWVNPDCGLKTRRDEEVVPALRHLVAATRAVRERLEA